MGRRSVKVLVKPQERSLRRTPSPRRPCARPFSQTFGKMHHDESGCGGTSVGEIFSPCERCMCTFYVICNASVVTSTQQLGQQSLFTEILATQSQSNMERRCGQKCGLTKNLGIYTAFLGLCAAFFGLRVSFLGLCAAFLGLGAAFLGLHVSFLGIYTMYFGVYFVPPCLRLVPRCLHFVPRCLNRKLTSRFRFSQFSVV